MGTLSLERGFDPSIYGPLSRRGHAVEEAPLALGGAQAVMIDHAAGVLHGASDPRKDGMALGF
jgi:gamma-glutamyltranspeptidase/glutathione hydrolase